MARPYSTRSLFRQIPNALLARYFQKHGVFTDFDFTAIKETQIDELFEVWLDRWCSKIGAADHRRGQLQDQLAVAL